MILWLKKVIGVILDKAQVLDLFVHQAQQRGETYLTVLMYHRIVDKADPLFIGCPVETFSTQMAYIAKHWVPVSEQQVVDSYVKGVALPKGAILVSFDDGYKDAVTLALPILKQHNIPAVIFVSSDPVAYSNPLWMDELSLMLKHTKKTVLQVDIDGHSNRYDLFGLDNRAAALFSIKKLLKCVSNEHREQVLINISRELGEVSKELRRGLLVNEKDMQALFANKVAIGGHTVSHPILSKVSDEKARQEIEGCRDYLLDLGYPQQSFCYPNGEKSDYNQATLKIVAEAAYHLAFTTEEGTNTPQSNPLELKRWHVSNLPIAALKYRLAKGLFKASKES